MNTKQDSSPMRPRTNCALVANPALRRNVNAETDAIAPKFPSGIPRPALRALLSAGLTELSHLSRISETDLAALHGIGPKAIGLLRNAMREMGIRFRQ